MEVQHEIISFSPDTGTVAVRYFSSEVPEGIQYGVDVPFVDGQYASMDALTDLINHMAPRWQLERIATLRTATTPDYLARYIPSPEELLPTNDDSNAAQVGGV